MHSHFLNKFLEETLHFFGCWLFLKKLNNESVVSTNNFFYYNGGGWVYNQIMSMFSKKYHGNILSMHLSKFRKSEKLKKQKIIFNNFEGNL